jgi:hypothetical protein
VNKLEALKKLKARVEEHGVIRHQYVEDGCYCVVGHLAVLGGVSEKAMDSLAIDHDTNGYSINLLNRNFGKVYVTEFLDALDQSGLNSVELQSLQRANDRRDDDGTLLLEEIDAMIAKEEAAQ